MTNKELLEYSIDYPNANIDIRELKTLVLYGEAEIVAAFKTLERNPKKEVIFLLKPYKNRYSVAQKLMSFFQAKKINGKKVEWKMKQPPLKFLSEMKGTLENPDYIFTFYFHYNYDRYYITWGVINYKNKKISKLSENEISTLFIVEDTI